LPAFFFFFFRRKRSKKACCHKAPFASILASGNLPSFCFKAIWLHGSPLVFAFSQTSNIGFQTLESKAKKGAQPRKLPTASRSAIRGAGYGNIFRQAVLLICNIARGGQPAYCWTEEFMQASLFAYFLGDCKK